MNYLAHCHIAYKTQTSMIGNLLGDFVKGEVARLPYSNSVKVGIELHRAVDSYTDQHEYTLGLKSKLGKWRRFGGIILDVFYDHQLAIHFNELETAPLEQFTHDCYRQLTPIPEQVPERFIRVVNGMKEGNWLAAYAKIENIERALLGISSRLKAKVELADSITWYQQNLGLFEQEFLIFYRELQIYCEEYMKKRDLN